MRILGEGLLSGFLLGAHPSRGVGTLLSWPYRGSGVDSRHCKAGLHLGACRWLHYGHTNCETVSTTQRACMHSRAPGFNKSGLVSLVHTFPPRTHSTEPVVRLHLVLPWGHRSNVPRKLLGHRGRDSVPGEIKSHPHFLFCSLTQCAHQGHCTSAATTLL